MKNLLHEHSGGGGDGVVVFLQQSKPSFPFIIP